MTVKYLKTVKQLKTVATTKFLEHEYQNLVPNNANP